MRSLHLIFLGALTTLLVAASVIPEATLTTPSLLDKRDSYLHCDAKAPESYKANTWAINQGIRYLQNHNGLCIIEANNKARVSCEWDSAIWAVNKSNRKMAVQCKGVAGEAQTIMNSCCVPTEGLPWDVNLCKDYDRGYKVRGWIEHSEYRVTVEADKC